MAWSHPNISLDDLISLIKPFIDMLILASGHQSSGLTVEWSPDSIKDALRWGIFFENVAKQLSEADRYELDAALSDLTSNPLFPHGLAKISSQTLSKSRNLVLDHFLNSQPLISKQITALFTAVIEIDIDHISKLDEFSKRNYLDKLTSQIESLNIMPSEKGFKSCNLDNTGLFFVIREILKRKDSVLYLSSIEKVLSLIKNNGLKQMDPSSSLRESERFKEFIAWKDWRFRCLSYFMSEKIIKILSGANLIFNAPKNQWINILQSLIVSSEQNFLEAMEICLLGLIAKQWNYLVEGFISQECDFIPISMQFSKLQGLLGNNSHDNNTLNSIQIDSKENDILEYVIKSLTSQPHQIWLLPPVLFAAAIPSQSILFKIYMAELEKQFNSSCNNYNQDGTEFNQKCDFEERIRGLYAFHITVIQQNFCMSTQNLKGS